MSDPKLVEEELAKFPHEIPNPGSIITHECMLTHHNDVGKNGLFVCLKNFVCLSKEMINLYFKDKRGRIFFWIRRCVNDANVSRMAINVTNGYPWHHSGFVFRESIMVTVMRQTGQDFDVFHLDDDRLGSAVVDRLNELATAVQNDFKNRFISCAEEILEEFTDKLVQNKQFNFDINNAKCLHKDCLGSSLWLNLGDGFIGCGGEHQNHSRMHFEATKEQHPLVVRIGSILSTGEGDVYSYRHDRMMIDPNLLHHLHQFNVDTTNLRRDAHSILETEIKWNSQPLDAGRSPSPPPGCQLNLIHGPGFTGLFNPHNLCYLHSTVQIMRATCHHFDKYFNAPSMLKQYGDANKDDPSMDVVTQTTKLITDLSSGEYSPAPKSSISAIMFKDAVGHGHPKFSTNNPQSVRDYLLYLLEKLELAGFKEIRDSFSFDLVVQTESEDAKQKQLITERMQCIDMDLAAVNDGIAQTAPMVTTNQFVKQFFKDEVVRALDPITHKTFTGKRSFWLKNVPEYLVISVGVKKFPNNQTNFDKIETILKVDEVLDMSEFMYEDDEDDDDVVTTGEGQGRGEIAVVSTPQPNEANANVLSDATDKDKPLIDKIALDKTDGNVEAALQWQQQHEMSLKRANQVIESSSTTQPKSGSFQFRIVSMIEFSGNRSDAGHAVAYVRKSASANSFSSPSSSTTANLSTTTVPKPQVQSSSSSTVEPDWVQIDDHIIGEVISDPPSQIPPINLAQICMYRRIKLD